MLIVECHGTRLRSQGEEVRDVKRSTATKASSDFVEGVQSMTAIEKRRAI